MGDLVRDRVMDKYPGVIVRRLKGGNVSGNFEVYDKRRYTDPEVTDAQRGLRDSWQETTNENGQTDQVPMALTGGGIDIFYP